MHTKKMKLAAANSHADLSNAGIAVHSSGVHAKLLQKHGGREYQRWHKRTCTQYQVHSILHQY